MVGIIEMSFAAGEDFRFGLLAKGLDFGLDDELIGTDYGDMTDRNRAHLKAFPDYI